jgi:hypothetical protein
VEDADNRTLAGVSPGVADEGRDRKLKVDPRSRRG